MAKVEGMFHILVVHSSAELYGSDRSLLDFIKHRGHDMAVTVVLPETGILEKELKTAGATVIVGEVCKIQRGMLSPSGMLRTLLAGFRAVRFLGQAHKKHRFDAVYSNTVAVLGGALCARWWGIPHVWHIREILTGSKTLTTGFQSLVARLSYAVVCNSGQTLHWIQPKTASSKYRVIWNGFDAPPVATDRSAARAELGITGEEVLFVLVGRINAWKGQKLFIEAFASLPPDARAHIKLAIVGSAPAGQEHYERDLLTHISERGVDSRVEMIAYRPDIEAIWIASDVVVVPSTEPEPFGRVAIEAMGFGRPVIAAKHGGLVEIVLDGETGLLVPPRDADALAGAMQELATNAGLRNRMGQLGRARLVSQFSVLAYATQLGEVIRSAARRGL